jgi:GMP synthase (glutamine-hydrolysing)
METAKVENCHFLIQGTILPDVIETVQGIKTQHNVLEQMKINTREVYGFKVIEPLVSLYKFQVRAVARGLGMPLEASNRQPFPGPGLSVRVVGEIKADKLASLKRATTIAEENLAEHKPSQYFAVIIDNVENRSHPAVKKVEETAAKVFGDKSKRSFSQSSSG